MKDSMKHSINSIQLMFLIHTVPIGVGILGMVRFVADRSGHDATLSVLLAGVFVQVGLVFMWLLLNRFRTLGLYDIHERIFGRWLGKAFNLFFVLYFYMTFFAVLRTFTDLVVTWLYPMTPVWLLTLLFLVPIVYAATCGLRLLGRLAVASFFLTLWLILLTYFPLREGTLSHIFPIGGMGLQNIFQGSLITALSILGFELLLIYYPYVAHKPDVLPASSIAAWGTILIYAIVSFTTILFFSMDQLEKTIWPMLTMFKHVQVPFIERFETIVIAIWLIRVVNTGGSYLWAAVEGIQKLVKTKKNITVWIYAGLVAATVVFSQWIEGRVQINMLLDVLSKVGLVLLTLYPLVLWLLSLVLKKKGKEEAEDETVDRGRAAAGAGR